MAGNSSLAVNRGSIRPVITCLLRAADGALKFGGAELADAGPPETDGAVMWLDILDQTADDLRWLGERFGFHPLTLEDCAHLDQRPKLEDFEGYMFVVVHGFTAPPHEPSEIELHEVHSFLGPRYLVTVHQDEIPVFHSVRRRFQDDPKLLARGADHALYAVVDALVDANFPILDALNEEIEKLEEKIIADARGSREDLQQIFRLRIALTTMRKVLSPQREVVGTLSRRESGYVRREVAPFFRDAYDHLNRIYEAIDTDRDLLGNTMEAYLSMISNRTNEIMKRLTLFSTIFLPLGALTGFFGMNFTHMPFESIMTQDMVLLTVLAVPTVMVVWFAWKRWL